VIPERSCGVGVAAKGKDDRRGAYMSSMTTDGRVSAPPAVKKCRSPCAEGLKNGVCHFAYPLKFPPPYEGGVYPAKPGCKSVSVTLAPTRCEGYPVGLRTSQRW